MTLIIGIPAKGINQEVPGIDLDHLTSADVEDILIQIYAPNVMEQGMSRADALKLALELDEKAALELVDSVIGFSGLNVPAAVFPAGDDIHISTLCV